MYFHSAQPTNTPSLFTFQHPVPKSEYPHGRTCSPHASPSPAPPLTQAPTQAHLQHPPTQAPTQEHPEAATASSLLERRRRGREVARGVLR